jgi:hypothetical protein
MGYQDGMNSGSSTVYHYIGFRVWNQVSPLGELGNAHNIMGKAETIPWH